MADRTCRPFFSEVSYQYTPKLNYDITIFPLRMALARNVRRCQDVEGFLSMLTRYCISKYAYFLEKPADTFHFFKSLPSFVDLVKRIVGDLQNQTESLNLHNFWSLLFFFFGDIYQHTLSCCNSVVWRLPKLNVLGDLTVCVIVWKELRPLNISKCISLEQCIEKRICEDVGELEHC